MEASAILEVIHAGRHDFLNHLQVILGFLCLNKTSEARKYIEEIIAEHGRLGRLVCLSLPEVALTLLVIQNKAVQKGVKIKCDLQVGFQRCSVSAGEISWALENSLGEVVSYLSPPQVIKRQVNFVLKNEEGFYNCSLDFFKGYEADFLKEKIKEVHDRLTVSGGRAEFHVNKEDRAKISIYFPIG